MFWFGLLAVVAVGAVVIVRLWRSRRPAYAYKTVMIQLSQETIEGARRFVEKERADGTKPIPYAVTRQPE